MTNRINIGHGLALNFTREEGEAAPSDVWLQFSAADGRSAVINIAAEGARRGGVIGDSLSSWASDRINDHLAALKDPVAARKANCERRDRCEEGIGICWCEDDR